MAILCSLTPETIQRFFKNGRYQIPTTVSTTVHGKKKHFSDLNKSSDPPVVFLLKLGNMVHLFLYSKNWKQLLSNSAGSSLMEVFKDVSVQDTYPHGRLSDCVIETFFYIRYLAGYGKQDIRL